MVFSGLSSAYVRGLGVRDLDIGSGWARVVGKASKEGRVPDYHDVAVQVDLLAERTDAASERLTPAAAGSHFRPPPAQSRHPCWARHALRQTFGTALAEAGVDSTCPSCGPSRATTTSTLPCAAFEHGGRVKHRLGPNTLRRVNLPRSCVVVVEERSIPEGLCPLSVLDWPAWPVEPALRTRTTSAKRWPSGGRRW